MPNSFHRDLHREYEVPDTWLFYRSSIFGTYIYIDAMRVCRVKLSTRLDVGARDHRDRLA